MAATPAFGKAEIQAAALKPSATALVLVDFINPMRFPGANALLRGALEAAHATARLKRRLSAQGAVAIYANDNYGIWRSDFKDLVKACQALSGHEGHQNTTCRTRPAGKPAFL